jgi:hypothetical protein
MNPSKQIVNAHPLKQTIKDEKLFYNSINSHLQNSYYFMPAFLFYVYPSLKVHFIESKLFTKRWNSF